MNFFSHALMRSSLLAYAAVLLSLSTGCSTGSVDGALGPTNASASPSSSTNDNAGASAGQPAGTTTSGETTTGAGTNPNGAGAATSASQAPYTVIGANFDPNELKYAYYYELSGGATTGSVTVSNCNVNIVLSSDPNACDSGQYVIQNANTPILSIAFTQYSTTTFMQPSNCSPPNWPTATPWPASFFFYGSASTISDGNTTARPVAQYAGSGNVLVDISTPLNTTPASVAYVGDLTQSPNQTPIYLNRDKGTRIQYNAVAKPCKFSTTLFQ